MGLSESFRALIREIVGQPVDEGAPPQFDRLARYRSRVDTCAGDGSALDVTPENKSISAEKNVPLLVGIPGAVATVQPGAIVWLGWDGGDPKKPKCFPDWESATLVSLTIGSSADNVVTKADIAAIKAAINAGVVVAQDGGASLKSTILAAWPTSVGSSSIKVQR